jgi:hypothetical protein
VSKRKQQTAVTGLHSVGDKWKTGVELGGGTMTLFRGSIGHDGHRWALLQNAKYRTRRGSTVVERRKHQDYYSVYRLYYDLQPVSCHTTHSQEMMAIRMSSYISTAPHLEYRMQS